MEGNEVCVIFCNDIVWRFDGKSKRIHRGSRVVCEDACNS